VKRRDLRVGHRVLVPWGNEMAEATGIELIASDDRGYVRIAVEVPGLEDGDEPSVIPIPAELLVEPTAA
jgi:hypothetical protein